MSDVSLRPATAADLPAIEAIVGAAYEKYTPRIGKPAGPMLDDYAALVEQAAVTLAVLAGEAVGLLVLLDAADHLLLDNIAVRPDRQGHGIGRRLIAEAEIEARRRGFRDLRLYTHATMVENLELYRRVGFSETHRVTEKGYARIYMLKKIA